MRIQKIYAGIVLICFTALMSLPTTAEAFFFNRAWERSVKQDTLQSSIKRDGKSNDEECNAMLEQISTRLMGSVKSMEKVDIDYTFFVNAKKQPNAYCTPGANISVNQGMFTAVNYNEDQVAFIVAHEIGHAQGQHMVKTLNGAVGFAVLAKLYLDRNDNTASQVLTGIAYNNILKKGYGMAHEKDADRRGFIYNAAAGYNPAAGAAAFQRLTEKYGDKNYNLLGDVLMPEEHPSNKDRIAAFMKQTKEYSGNRVISDGKTIFIMNKATVFPAKLDNMSAAERTYLITGNLARALHDLGAPQPVAVTDNDELYMGSYYIMRAIDGDGDAHQIAQDINTALGL